MARRANGEGSIYRRSDGRWVAELSYEDEAGVKRRRTVYGRTQTEARGKLKDARKRLEDGEPIKDAKMTLADWLDQWVAKGLEASDRKRATKDLYKVMVNAHLKPTLGAVTLEKLRPSDVEALIVAKRKAKCRRRLSAPCTPCCVVRSRSPFAMGWCGATSPRW